MQVSECVNLEDGFAGRRVLVTGGGGLIGSRIVGRLRNLGARPLVLCRMDAYPPDAYQHVFGVERGGADVVVGDVADAALVRRLVAECEYVVHAAGLADVAACTRRPADAITANVVGTQAVLDAAAAAADRIKGVTFVSSASVYGNGPQPRDADAAALRAALDFQYGRSPQLFQEDAALDPVSVYANSKAWGEAQTRLILGSVNVPYSIVRYFSVYGEPQVVKENSHSWVVAWFTVRAYLGLPLHLNGGGHQIRDLVHVDDVAEATLRALVTPAARNATLNVGTGVPTAIRDVAAMVHEHFPQVAVMETPMPPGDPVGGYASTARMEELLGWRPAVAIADGVARYVDWLARTPAAVPLWLRSAATAA
ncbi:NAD-dependent epimerase/dehydratase family protein [Streptomyces sp. SID1121]|uniref:NAD-dependent epimerase/dehydratase family protein n=1 Tax=Streptomyces sp. SID1121 TaxID=3425888 RepID=UPI004056CCC4